MNPSEEEQVVLTPNNTKKTRLPTINKIIKDQKYEDLRKQILEAIILSGVPYEHVHLALMRRRCDAFSLLIFCFSYEAS